MTKLEKARDSASAKKTDSFQTSTGLHTMKSLENVPADFEPTTSSKKSYFCLKLQSSFLVWNFKVARLMFKF